jgi:hypothetical protein
MPKEIESLAQQLRNAYGSGGTQAFWRAYLEHEQRTAAMHPLGVARIYAHLGDRDRCIGILDKEYRQRDFMLVVWIRTDPEFDRVRSDPRFQALLTKIGYPQ